MWRAQVSRYFVVSLISFGVTLGLAEALRLLSIRAEAAFALTLAVMLGLNFLACRIWIFRNDGKSVMAQFAQFAASIVGFRLVEYGGFIVLHNLLGLRYLWAIAVVLCVSSASKFLFFRGVVFAAVKPSVHR
jgi:putative flippase GtrA